jgi:hypothetical protein
LRVLLLHTQHRLVSVSDCWVGEKRERTAAAGLYDTELREKTRFWSARPVLRRWEAAAVVPLM